VLRQSIVANCVRLLVLLAANKTAYPTLKISSWSLRERFELRTRADQTPGSSSQKERRCCLVLSYENLNLCVIIPVLLQAHQVPDRSSSRFRRSYIHQTLKQSHGLSSLLNKVNQHQRQPETSTDRNELIESTISLALFVGCAAPPRKTSPQPM